MLINTRADLDSLKGTPAYAQALGMIKGSLMQRVNVAQYPEGYGEAGYQGLDVEPVWEDRENLQVLNVLGFSKEEFLMEFEAEL